MIVTPAADEIELFRDLVAQRLGLHFEDGKLDFLADVLRKRMEDTRCHSFSSYKQRIFTSPGKDDEISALAEQLTVGETYFFRYAEHFEAFAEVVVPSCIQTRNHVRRLRILSAGCASGEEPYSLAILLRERFPELTPWNVEILAFDINPVVVGKAKRAQYSPWSLRETPDELKPKYFRPEGREVRLHECIRAAVSFEERNLVDDDPLFWRQDAFDIVFCRNVTMYFTTEAARSVIAHIAQSLTPGGFLFLGHAETLRGISQDFHLRHTHETFYYQRRESCEVRNSVAVSRLATDGDSFPKPISTVIETGDSWFDIIRRASERITSLTAERSRPPARSFERTATQVANSQASVPAAIWDRTLVLELLRKERFEAAMKVLRTLSPESKTDPDAQLLRAVLLTNGGELREAEKACRRLLQLDELNAGAHYLMALCCEHAGDRDSALQHDRTAVYLDSAFAMPHLHIGLIAKRSAEMETARLELSHALSLLGREDASRILLFGGGFTRETLAEFCRTELRACGGRA